MIDKSSILIILLVIILVVIVIKRIDLKLNITKYFDSGNNINFQLQNFRYEGFENPKNKLKLEIRKTNIYNKVFSNDKYTIWEPESIDDYLPVGHILTKKDKKPKDFAILVNKHQTIKPDRYNIVSISNDNYGIWQPISNDKNYVSLGSVYSKEYPSKYSVRLVPKGFVLKTDLSEMVISNKIKRNDKGYELWSLKDSSQFVCNNRNNPDEFESLKDNWTINKNMIDVNKKLYIKYTLSYKKIMSYDDNKLNKKFVIWRPIPPKNFYSLGDIIVNSDTDPNNNLQTIVVHKSFCKFPVNYGVSPTIEIKNKGETIPYTFWKPTPPVNYQFLGDVVIKGKEEPADEELIACISVDYLERVNKETHNMIWNNVNEENPKSLWGSYLNFVSCNNRYSMPTNSKVALIKNLTSSDIDLMDNAKSIMLKFKKNNEKIGTINEIYTKNMLINSLSNKFDIDKERIQVDTFNEEAETIKITILSRNIDENSILVEDVIKQIEKTLSIGEIKIFNENRSEYIITIINGGVVEENINVIDIDNSDYIEKF